MGSKAEHLASPRARSDLNQAFLFPPVAELLGQSGARSRGILAGLTTLPGKTPGQFVGRDFAVADEFRGVVDGMGVEGPEVVDGTRRGVRRGDLERYLRVQDEVPLDLEE